MKVTPTAIPEVRLIEPAVFEDSRGLFFESYNQRVFAAAGIVASFVQDNQSVSRKGVLRGLHYQVQEPQGKLVRCVHGEIFDVAVDLRRWSPTFGKWEGQHLSESNRRMLWIPAGFAHGFLSLSGTAEVLYKATAFYAPDHERTILWNDPAIHINWPVESIGEPAKAGLAPAGPVQPGSEPMGLALSDKDRAGLLLKDAEVYESANSL